MKLHKDVIDKIYKHALDEYPDECCGIITGDMKNQSVHLCDNIQNRMLAEDPESYPRDARTAYLIDRREFDQIVSSAKEKGREIIAFYHSHCEHEAYFSEEDFAAQTVFGEPEFPHACHIIVSVMNRKIHDMKCYQWDRQLQRFIVMEECG